VTCNLLVLQGNTLSSHPNGDHWDLYYDPDLLALSPLTADKKSELWVLMPSKKCKSRRLASSVTCLLRVRLESINNDRMKAGASEYQKPGQEA
jgi:hypothetical protein